MADAEKCHFFPEGGPQGNATINGYFVEVTRTSPSATPENPNNGCLLRQKIAGLPNGGMAHAVFVRGQVECGNCNVTEAFTARPSYSPLMQENQPVLHVR